MDEPQRETRIMGWKGARHPAIARLSSDHHAALLQAVALKRATEEDAQEIAAAFVAFWQAKGQLHFQVEEQTLLPLWAAFVGTEVAVDPLVGQMLHEHVELRALELRIERGDTSMALLRETGQRLDAHVRLEERKVFPKIQESLSDDQLEQLADAVEAAEGD